MASRMARNISSLRLLLSFTRKGVVQNKRPWLPGSHEISKRKRTPKEKGHGS